MPDPSALNVSSATAEAPSAPTVQPPAQAQLSQTGGAALDPDMKVVKNYVRKTVEEKV